MNAGNGFGKKKFLFVSWESLSGDVAWQLKKEGHEVKCYIKAEEDQDVYDGFLEKVDDWKKWVEWADCIVFDDIWFGKEAEELRKKGKLVFGGSVYTDKLEDDREFGQQEMQSAGVNTLPRWNFTNFDEAIEFIKKNPDRYVFKPAGKAQNEKELLFVGNEDDGSDIIGIFERSKKTWSNKIKTFQLQKFASGVEVAVGAFFNGKEFIYPININFEHKRMFPGDLGPNCYSQDTEILTANGWKRFNQISNLDSVAAVNPTNLRLNFEKPRKIYWKKYKGKMISFKSRSIDLLVTPNHKMLLMQRKRGKKTIIREAGKYAGEHYIFQAVNWEGRDEDFVLPSFCYGFNRGFEPVKIPIRVWAMFMGLYLSEGWIVKMHGKGDKSKRMGMRVYIAQRTHVKQFEAMLKKMPFKYRYDNKSSRFVINSSQLVSYLEQFGHAKNKFVPENIKNASVETIKDFLKYFCLGDGCLRENGGMRLFSTSKRMIDDIQELLIKCGYTGTIVVDKSEDINRRKSKSTLKIRSLNDVYSIEQRKTNKTTIRQENYSHVDYAGYIGCVSVSTGFVMVRRNGRTAVCGNTGEMGTLMYFSEPNALFDMTLQRMKPKLAKSGYVGYVDINCIANAKGIYPLEWTCRTGYPHISIAMDGISIPIGEMIFRLASGENFDLKTKRGFQVGVVLAVPPFPFDDQKVFAMYKDSTIYFKKPNFDGVHLGDVKVVDGDWKVAGASGYVLVITGSGTTVEEARKQAYSRVQNIFMPNMFYRTDIGTKWYGESDKLQTWGYMY